MCRFPSRELLTSVASAFAGAIFIASANQRNVQSVQSQEPFFRFAICNLAIILRQPPWNNLPEKSDFKARELRPDKKQN